MADRLRHGGVDPQQLHEAVEAPRDAGARRPATVADGDDRHRHRHLHDPGADRGARRWACRVEQVTVEIGDIDLPPAPGSGGSWGAGSSRRGVYTACMALREQDGGSRRSRRSGADRASSTARVSVGGRNLPRSTAFIAELRRPGSRPRANHAGQGDVQDYSQNAYGAHLRRGRRRHRLPAKPACAACWACSPPAASSTQRRRARRLSAGLIWGLGSALHEETVVDQRYRHVRQRRPCRVPRAGPCRHGRRSRRSCCPRPTTSRTR